MLADRKVALCGESQARVANREDSEVQEDVEYGQRVCPEDHDLGQGHLTDLATSIARQHEGPRCIDCPSKLTATLLIQQERYYKSPPVECLHTRLSGKPTGRTARCS